MSQPIKRYHNLAIINHLASRYVLGLLTPRVKNRIEQLLTTNEPLEQRIIYWQDQFANLDQQTSALTPQAQTWQKITQALALQESSKTKDDSSRTWFARSKQKLPNLLTSLLAITLITLLSCFIIERYQSNEDLNCVAILTDAEQQPHVLVLTYTGSKKIMLEPIKQTKIANDEVLEVWLIANSNKQARSLGVITSNAKIIKQPLNNTNWHLINQPHSLFVTIEKSATSRLKPSNLVVARGVCVPLKS